LGCNAGVAKNPNTPAEILEKLAGDKDWVVRDAARERIKGLLRR